MGITGISKALKRERQISTRQLNGKRIYLWFIGVRREDQHKGAGSRLLSELIDVMDIESRTIILETSTARNLSWYTSLGFQTYARLDLRYHLYFLKKEPD